MKFVLNCDSVSQLGTTINSYATELASTTSEISALDPKTSYFDFAGAIRVINTNVNAAADKMSNTCKYIQAVVDKHTELQATLRFDMPVIEIDTVMEPNGKLTGENPTLIDGENKDEITEGEGTGEGVTDTIEDDKTIIASPNPDGLIPQETYIIPEGNGTKMSYEVHWEDINEASPALTVKNALGDKFQWDKEGFGKVGDRYVVACTTTFGLPGEYIDFELEDGTIIPCIMGDSKGSPKVYSDGTVVNKWGHNNGKTTVEFIVDWHKWYDKENSIIKDNPGSPSNHPEWGQRVVKATRYGNPFL